MEAILRDIKFGFRQLVRNPGFTIVSAVALGLGIASVTTQLSVTNGILLEGLPFPEPEKIAHVERINVERENFNAEPTILEFIEWRDNQKAFEGLAGFYIGTANFTFGNLVERYNGAFISANTFEMLRAKAALGRTLVPSDDFPGAPHVTVLSHKVWKNDLGEDPDIIGKPAVLNGRPTTIVGVMPEGFGFPINEDLWVPLFKQQDPSALSWGDPMMTLEVFGRLLPGVNFDQANASMSVLAGMLEEKYPDTNEGFRAMEVKPFIDEFLGDQTVTMTGVMLLITVLILVIACANVANLLLARSMRRQREIAIRSALGASRHRIISQFLTESILLAILGAILGITYSVWNLGRIREASVEFNTPSWMEFSLDWKVFVAALFVTIATGIISGIVPALRASGVNENEVLKDSNRTGTSLNMGKFSRALVVLQISVAAIILTLVVLFVQSMNNALSIPYEYNPDEVLTARIGLFEELYPEDLDRANFIEALITNLQNRPEVDYAATTDRYQFLWSNGVRYSKGIPGEDTENLKIALIQRVSPDFFDSVQLPIYSGRNFYPEDFTATVPRYAIVNRAFAEREWSHTNPIGQRFKAEISQQENEEEGSWLEIVGVSGSMQESGLFNEDDDGAAFFVPQTQSDFSQFITILLRGSGDPQKLASILREEIASLDSNLPVYEVGTPREVNNRATAQFQFFGSIFTGFGVLATILAGVGIYGVISFSVNQRIMEFGIRQALGATRTGVFKLVYAHAFKQLLFGFIIAVILLSPVILSPGIKESMNLFFYEIDPDSVLPYALSFGFVTLVAVLSAAPPAFRAARIEPAQALRYE
ncbi:ABC transporter permease [Puniceicoccales bacterium CK1056]|uniref:ABC transporter permease n=1 Tax=Oceanipulchritudo coccoides TaxID=2706888 RepID=A0A6B2M0V2_9BACT|nr:ABC transporter permease [Oceanipulchritudo coccoides]NDV61986.1 ABC transporter permease [Oceanipulchritudo coccoides]